MAGSVVLGSFDYPQPECLHRDGFGCGGYLIFHGASPLFVIYDLLSISYGYIPMQSQWKRPGLKLSFVFAVVRETVESVFHFSFNALFPSSALFFQPELGS